MTQRERLIELLRSDPCESTLNCETSCQYFNCANCHAERMADYLIANGVTVDVEPVVRCKDCLHSNECKPNCETKMCVLR